MKIDPYKHKERYLNWKEKVREGIPEISQFNSDLTLRYLNDMEHGINISSTNKKGCRSYIRLNTLKEKTSQSLTGETIIENDKNSSKGFFGKIGSFFKNLFKKKQ